MCLIYNNFTFRRGAPFSSMKGIQFPHLFSGPGSHAFFNKNGNLRKRFYKELKFLRNMQVAVLSFDGNANNVVKDSASDILSKSNVEVITAPTGTGKTYALLHKAICHASEGGTAVICFPNINLVSENELLIQEYLKKPEFKNWNIKVVMLTLTESRENHEILDVLIKGRAIILTLHSYINCRGDFFNNSSAYFLMNIFKPAIIIMTDESHLLFVEYQKNIPLTQMVGEAKKRLRTIQGGITLQQAIIAGDTISDTGESVNSGAIRSGSSIIGYNLAVRSPAYTPPIKDDLHVIPSELFSFFSNLNSPRLECETIKEVNLSKPFNVVSNLQIMVDSENKPESADFPYFKVWQCNIFKTPEENAEFKGAVLTQLMRIFNHNIFCSFLRTYEGNLVKKIKAINNYNPNPPLTSN